MEYCERYGATWEHIAQISAKNHRHSISNPYAQFQRGAGTAADVLAARKITREITLPMCSPTSDGAAAAVVVSEAFVQQHKLQDRAIELAGLGTATDSVRLYHDRSRIELAGADMTRRAAQAALQQAEITMDQVQVIELHDCFAPNELIAYEHLGLCQEGQAHKLVERGDNTFGGYVFFSLSV